MLLGETKSNNGNAKGKGVCLDQGTVPFSYCHLGSELGCGLTGCCNIHIIHIPCTWSGTAECEPGNRVSAARLEGSRHPLPSRTGIVHGREAQGQVESTCSALASSEFVIHRHGIVCPGAGVQRLAEGLGNCAGVRIVWRFQVGFVGIVPAIDAASWRDNGVVASADL